MRRVRIRRGLDLRLDGEPEQRLHEGPVVRSVGVVAADYPGLRPRVLVAEGQRVRLGEPLVVDRRRPELRLAAPGCGVVRTIERGERRALVSVAIELDGRDELRFEVPSGDPAREHLVALLLDSGLWTALRTRPFGRTPDPGTAPAALFVTALESDPLAPRADVVIAAAAQEFARGLDAVARLADGPVFACTAPGVELPGGDSARVEVVEFDGPHPAGLPGTHIHRLHPAGASRCVWHVGYQDVIAIGALLATGRLRTERVVALAGPLALRPRLVRTRLGASTDDLVHGELRAEGGRVISGSVLSGRRAAGATAYLGRFHRQVCALPEATTPGPLWPGPRRRTWTTALHGRRGPLVPLDRFERVLPLDVLPAPLFRALLTGDLDTAAALGALELDEEDLALCTVVCPSRIDYGPLLREALRGLEKR